MFCGSLNLLWRIRISKLRIIGGKWRSRKIDFLPLQGVRPTNDMMRETLFNWLAPVIDNASCLDLFAGSGALGFEALSRGARQVVMVDSAPKVVSSLRANIERLQAINARCYCATIPRELHKISGAPFDIVFLDPPFKCDLVKSTCQQLHDLKFLQPNSLLYIEVKKQVEIVDIIPQGWQVLRSKVSGMVESYLVQYVLP